MAGPLFFDRTQESSTTTGTGTYTLAGATTGFQAWSVVGNANTAYYMATDGTGWEVGLGTYTSSGTTLARTTILASSNAGSAVNWAAGTRTISLVATATWFTSALVSGGALGTPSSGVATNLTGTAAGLTAGNVTTNANLTGPITSVGNATSIASSVALPGSPTTTTQTANDNSTKLATTAYVDSKPAGGLALLATMTPSGSPATVTSANFVSTPYTNLLLVFDGLVFTGNSTLTVNVSSDNASTFDTAITAGPIAAGTAGGSVIIYRAGVTANKVMVSTIATALPSSPAGQEVGRFTTKTSPTTNIRLAATSLTGGNVYVYGVP